MKQSSFASETVVLKIVTLFIDSLVVKLFLGFRDPCDVMMTYTDIRLMVSFPAQPG